MNENTIIYKPQNYDTDNEQFYETLDLLSDNTERITQNVSATGSMVVTTYNSRIKVSAMGKYFPLMTKNKPFYIEFKNIKHVSIENVLPQAGVLILPCGELRDGCYRSEPCSDCFWGYCEKTGGLLTSTCEFLEVIYETD